MTTARIVRGNEGAEGLDCLFKVTGDDTEGRFDFMVATVEYCTGPPLHTHEAQDDTFFVISGVLAVQIGDEVFDLEPGDFAMAPPGVPHTFDNLRRDQPPVETVNLMTPGGFDHFMGDLALAEASSMSEEELATMGARHGVTWVGPPMHERLGIG